MEERKKIILYGGLVCSMLLWGLGWPSTKILTHYGSPIHLAIIRFLFTSLTLLIILVLLKQALLIQRNGLKYLLLASALMAIYTLLFLKGIQEGLPGAGGVLVTTLTPIITYILTIFLAKRKPRIHEYIGLSLGFLAACFLMHVWTGVSNIFQSGNIFFFLSCFLWAILSRITAKARDYGAPLTFSFWMYVCCFIFLFPFANFTTMFGMMQTRDNIFWVNLFYNACINTGLATTFFFFTTTKLGAAKTSSFLYIVPFAAAFFSWWILDEAIHWYTAVGGLLGIAAVYIFNRKREFK